MSLCHIAEPNSLTNLLQIHLFCFHRLDAVISFSFYTLWLLLFVSSARCINYGKIYGKLALMRKTI